MNLRRPSIRPLLLQRRENMIQPILSRNRIGILVLLLLVAFPAISHALCDVDLQWDANNPAPEGYLLFGREEGQSYDYNDPWWQGDNSFTQCTIDQLREDRTYFFVVRAYVGNDVSGDSNEVRFSYADGTNGSPSSLSNNSVSTVGSSSGGGSGAGCFLQSLLGSE